MSYKKKVRGKAASQFTTLIVNYYGLLLFLVIMPVLVYAFWQRTTNRADAALLPPTLMQTVTGGASEGTRVTTKSMNAGSGLYIASVSTKPYRVVSSISGLGLRWTRLKSQCGARSSTGSEVWIATGNSTSGSVTAILSKAAANTVMVVVRYTGVDMSDPVSDPIGMNTKGINGPCTGGTDSKSYLLPANTDRNSVVFTAVGIRLRSHTPASWIREITEYHMGTENGDKAGIAVGQGYMAAPTRVNVAGTLSGETDWAVVAVQIHGYPDSDTAIPTTVVSPTPTMVRVSPTVRPSSTPTVIHTPTPTRYPTPTSAIRLTGSPTKAPTGVPTVRPTDVPFPTFPPSSPVSGIWTSSGELANKPMSGEAWNAVKSAADSLSISPNPDLDNQDDGVNVQVLAAAIVYSRTGDQSYRSKVISALQKVETFTPSGRTLAWARETGAYAMAADLIGYRTSAFMNKMRAMAETYKCSQVGKSLFDMYKMRPNNWGSQAFGSLTAIYAYLGDIAKLREVRDHMVQSINGPKPSTVEYGSLTWQCNENDPRWINPVNCMKSCGGIVNVEGIIPDDMRRGGNCATSPGMTGYPWEGLQGFVMGARVLERVGMSIWQVGDSAICRAAAVLEEGRFGSSWKATGDDLWQLVILDRACGKNWSSGRGPGIWGAGKNTGWGYVVQ